MKKTCLFSFLFTVAFIIYGYSQDTSVDFYYHKNFTKSIEKYRLDIRVDSLPHYVLSNKNNKYLKNVNLNLIQPETDNNFFVILDENPTFPQINLSSHVTNLMDNDIEHTLAFYSLDADFVSEVLNADWAVDTQFVPKDHPDLNGYARSFYNEERNLQITLILLTRDLPLLSTPMEMRSLRFDK